MGQKSWHRLSWFLCFRFSHEAAFKVLARAGISSEAQMRRDPLPFSGIVGKIQSIPFGFWTEASIAFKILADTNKNSLPCRHLYRAGHNMTAGFLKASKGKSLLAQSKSSNLTYYNHRTDILLPLPYSIVKSRSHVPPKLKER